jgi:hypothetical protein
MKFYVSMKVDGRVTVEVDAKNAEEAFDKAIERWETEDLTSTKWTLSIHIP